MGTAADHTPWARQVEDYRDHFTVITYDARGTGRSTHPPDSPPPTPCACWRTDAAALLGFWTWARHVSGLSLGSATAQELAINHQEKVKSLQLHCTWGRSDEWFCRDDRVHGVHGRPR